MKVMKKIIFLLLMLVIISPQVMAVPMAPMNSSNFSVVMNFDTANGTYTKYIFGSIFTTGQMPTLMEMSYGVYKPWGDAWQNATGDANAWYWIFLIVWSLVLMSIMITTGNTTLPLILGLGSASGIAVLIPSMFLQAFTMFFALCAGSIFYKLWIDR